jgi:HlyD family secretion protein
MPRNRWLFVLSALGLLLGMSGAWYFARRPPPEPPAFRPTENPYPHGLFANGIIESAQSSGENVSIYPDVAGRVVAVRVSEGETVTAGTPLVEIDPSVQAATVEQLEASAAAECTVLDELRHQPRPEALAVAAAAVDAARAQLKVADDQATKRVDTAALDARALSRDVVDSARDARAVAAAALAAAERQYELVRAGAWQFDIAAEEKRCVAARQQARAARSLLERFVVRATVDGVVLAIAAPVGGYVSPTGTYDTYTQAATPVVVMSRGRDALAVRVFVDEILLSRLPDPNHIVAQMQVRGTLVRIPLRFVRTSPYVVPKVELSDNRAEQVDLRVLPVLFAFDPPPRATLYPGQLVDVYIGTR